MCSENIDISHVSGLTWTPVRTKPRQEKKLAQYCTSKDVTYYLPLKTSARRYNRRTVEFTLPMFPGYIFCALNEELYRSLLISGTIVYRIQMDESSEKRLISDLNDLINFEKISQEESVQIRPEIVSGAVITVKNGALHGVRGIVEKRDDTTVITVNVDILGQSVSAAIDIEDVELGD